MGQVFTLRQLFTQWGVDLSQTSLGDLRGQLAGAIDGEQFEGNPRDVQLRSNQEIVLTLATS